MKTIMKLYHGSKSGIDGPVRPVSHDCCDFGSGFYLGSEPTQPLTLICTKEKPVFYTCEADFSDLSVCTFKPDVEWAMFVAWNRGLIPEEFRSFYDGRFRPIVESSDVIVGKIANDRMVVVLDWFFKSFVSDIGLLESLKTLNLGDQYVCKTARACERVHIVDQKILSPAECERLTDKSRNQHVCAVKTGESSKDIYRQADENRILQAYGLHTESNELAVEDLRSSISAHNSAVK